MTRDPAAHRVCGGVFTPDSTLPADPITGEQTCVCQLKGKAGDAHHTVPPPTEDGQMRAAGERSEG